MNTPKSINIEPHTPASSASALTGGGAVTPTPAFTSGFKNFGVLTVPNKKDFRSRTGLVHCVVRREMGQGRFGLAAPKLVFALQGRDGAETPFLKAEKVGAGRKFVIYDVSEKGSKVFGTLTNSTKLGTSLIYNLNQHEEQVACISYQVPSILTAVLEGRPRHAQIAVATAHVDKKMGLFEAKIKNSINKTSSLEGVADLNFAHVFENTSPYSKGGGRWGLNFKGRGRQASPKNMQMENNQGEIMLQIAKWDKNVYNVDFRAPFNMFQAFGFALAQIEL